MSATFPLILSYHPPKAQVKQLNYTTGVGSGDINLHVKIKDHAAAEPGAGVGTESGRDVHPGEGLDAPRPVQGHQGHHGQGDVSHLHQGEVFDMGKGLMEFILTLEAINMFLSEAL